MSNSIHEYLHNADFICEATYPHGIVRFALANPISHERLNRNIRSLKMDVSLCPISQSAYGLHDIFKSASHVTPITDDIYIRGVRRGYFSYPIFDRVSHNNFIATYALSDKIMCLAYRVASQYKRKYGLIDMVRRTISHSHEVHTSQNSDLEADVGAGMLFWLGVVSTRITRNTLAIMPRSTKLTEHDKKGLVNGTYLFDDTEKYVLSTILSDPSERLLIDSMRSDSNHKKRPKIKTINNYSFASSLCNVVGMIDGLVQGFYEHYYKADGYKIISLLIKYMTELNASVRNNIEKSIWTILMEDDIELKQHESLMLSIPPFNNFNT